MSKNLLEAAERLVDELTPSERLQIFKKLERAAEHLPTLVRVRWAKRRERPAVHSEWDRLFAAIDRRRKGRRFTTAEIVREVKAYRREHAGG